MDYVLGLAKNARLIKRIGEATAQRRSGTYDRSGQARRVFKDFPTGRGKSWSRARAWWARPSICRKGANPRFVVTSLPAERVPARARCTKDLYCARGDMENRIKEQQLDLFADRTSTDTMRANQIRLYFASFACRMTCATVSPAPGRWAPPQPP